LHFHRRVHIHHLPTSLQQIRHQTYQITFDPSLNRTFYHPTTLFTFPFAPPRDISQYTSDFAHIVFALDRNTSISPSTAAATLDRPLRASIFSILFCLFRSRLIPCTRFVAIPVRTALRQAIGRPLYTPSFCTSRRSPHETRTSHPSPLIAPHFIV